MFYIANTVRVKYDFSMSELPAPPRPRGRKTKERARTLSRDAIVEVALAIVDEHGVDGLSMRAVAHALDTGPASLYAHVADKDELLELLLDEVIGEMRLAPAELSWQEQLKFFVREQRRILTQHRDLARVTLARIPTGPKAIAAIDAMFGNLMAAGMPPKTVSYAVDLLALFGGAHAYEESLLITRLGPEETMRYFQEVSEHFAALPKDRFPNIHAMGAENFGGADDDSEERFEWALDVLVDGIAAQMKRATPRSSRARGTARSPR